MDTYGYEYCIFIEQSCYFLKLPLEFLGEVLRVLLGLLHFGELGVLVLFLLLEQTLHLLQLMLLLLFCLNMTTSVVMSH